MNTDHAFGIEGSTFAHRRDGMIAVDDASSCSLTDVTMAVLRVLPDVVGIRPSPAIETLARAYGLGRSGLVIHRLRLRNARAITLVVAPRHVWRYSRLRNLLRSLKNVARMRGIRVVLATEAAARRVNRLTNALLIDACGGDAPGLPDRARIARSIEAHGGVAPMAELCEVVGEDFHPVAAILALVGEGELAVQLDRPIGSDSCVTLASRAHLLRMS